MESLTDAIKILDNILQNDYSGGPKIEKMREAVNMLTDVDQTHSLIQENFKGFENMSKLHLERKIIYTLDLLE